MEHTNITPEAIEAQALTARVTMSEVLAKAGVSPSVFYKWKRDGSEPRALTKMRIWDAVSGCAA